MIHPSLPFEEASQSQVDGRPLVLVADADPMTRGQARTALGRFGFLVAEAEHGIAALDILETSRPEIMLLDVHLAQLDSCEVCTRWRALDHGINTPILMMAEPGDISSIKPAYDAGATDFVVKPMNWEILGHRLDYMLRASRTTDDLRESQRKLESAQRIAKLGYWEWDLGTDRFHCSKEAREILGLEPSEAEPTLESLVERVEARDQLAFLELVHHAAAGHEGRETEYQIRAHPGTRFVRQQLGVSIKQDGKPERVTGTVQDVTERRQAEERIRFLANYDTVTGLSNRHAFSENLESALEHARRRGQRMGLLFMDLDRFKRINDTLGHQIGDELLQEVADRLVDLVVEESGCEGQVATNLRAISRFGGDEFVLLLPSLNETTQATAVARSLLDAFTEPFEVAGRRIQMTGSIGVAVFPDDGDGAESLLSNADAAMYHAKRRGGNSYQFYSESMNSSALEHLLLENELRRALERDELKLHYQAQVNQDGIVCGAEALIRWQHPQRGLVPPALFIPVAEESGQILEVGEWVLNEACRQAAEWQTSGRPELRVSVNLSARQIEQPDFTRIVQQALDRSGAKPELIALELTESVLMRDAEAAVRTLQDLKSMGVKLYVDDFGTGYSSLSYLRRFPLDGLKIDRSFIQRLPGDDDHLAIVRAVFAMAKSLKLGVIAEGVETPAQRQLLESEGCDELQGFLFGRPQPADEFSGAKLNGNEGPPLPAFLHRANAVSEHADLEC